MFIVVAQRVLWEAAAHFLLVAFFLWLVSLYSIFHQPCICIVCGWSGLLNDRSGRSPQTFLLSSCGTVFAVGQSCYNLQMDRCWRRGGFSALRLPYNLKRTSKRALKAFGVMSSSFLNLFGGKFKSIPNGNRVFTWKDSILTFLHDGYKGPIFPGAACFLLVVMHHTSLSPVLWQEDASAESNASIEAHHFCVWTHVI